MTNPKSVLQIGTIAHAAMLAAGAQNQLGDVEVQKIGEEKTKERIPLPQGEFPDRLSIERGSRYYSSACEFIGVNIDGVESKNIVAYHCSGRTARVAIRTENGSLIPDGRGGYKSEVVNDVDIEVFWRVQPSRQVKRALRRMIT